MTVPIFIHPPGTRVRLCRGRHPIDASVLGRTGLVVHVDDYRPGYYGVTLDGESDIRVFAEDELQALDGAGA
jgi:hypothetical protein